MMFGERLEALRVGTYLLRQRPEGRLIFVSGPLDFGSKVGGSGHSGSQLVPSEIASFDRFSNS